MSSMARNVIVLSSDEMRGDAPGFMGNPDCRTPNLDRLAQRGVVFAQHYTVHGKCVPARIAMQTGRYSHTDGFRTIYQHMPSSHPHLLGTLKGLGYESAVFGHNHVWEDFWGNNKKGSGFPDYHSFTEGSFDHLLKKQWPAPGPGRVTPMDLGRGFDYGGRIDKPIDGFCDHNRAEQAVEYLTKVRDRSRPFYLHVNFSAPHPPYRVEEPYFSMYDRAAITAWPHDLPKNAPLPMRAMRRVRTGAGATDAALREIQAVYYGMITLVDAHIGRVLDAIAREKLFEESVVLFWVDHGDFAGQYGLVEKWDTAMADCIMHVPFILCSPGLPGGRRVASLSEHTDIAATVLELLGVTPDATWGMHGESLLPVIGGGKGKEAVFGDGGHEAALWKRFDPNMVRNGVGVDGKQETYLSSPESMARTAMCRTEKWKLVVRLAGGNELYDLQSDPRELNNLWGDTRYDATVMALQQKMIEWRLKTDTDRPRQEMVAA
jgi:arylsulfatase A-like enzyme